MSFIFNFASHHFIDWYSPGLVYLLIESVGRIYLLLSRFILCDHISCIATMSHLGDVPKARHKLEKKVLSYRLHGRQVLGKY